MQSNATICLILSNSRWCSQVKLFTTYYLGSRNAIRSGAAYRYSKFVEVSSVHLFPLALACVLLGELLNGQRVRMGNDEGQVPGGGTGKPIVCNIFAYDVKMELNISWDGVE